MVARERSRKQAPRAARTPRTPSDPRTGPATHEGGTIPADVATLQTHLRLARAQNADLHRQLQAHPPAPTPVAETTGLFPTGQGGPEGAASCAEEHRSCCARLEHAKAIFRTQEAQRKALEAEVAHLTQAYGEEREIARIEYGRVVRERDYFMRERDTAIREVERVRSERDRAQGDAKLWEAIAHLARLQAPPAPATPDQVFKQLLSVAHPDRWSRGQLALELAHELVIIINNIRQRDGRRG
jgi:hypothetical protein